MSATVERGYTRSEDAGVWRRVCGTLDDLEDDAKRGVTGMAAHADPAVASTLVTL